MSKFKEEWEAKKLLKKAKKKAVKKLESRGYSNHNARSAVNSALDRINRDYTDVAT
jgi:SOS response regulatory protein OraA/RecX